MLTTIKYGNLAVAFLLELAALAALGYSGFHTGNGPAAKVALGPGAPVLMAVFWGAFLAPKAAVTVAAPLRLALKILVFGLATAALAFAGRTGWAWGLGLAVVANAALLRLLGQ